MSLSILWNAVYQASKYEWWEGNFSCHYFERKLTSEWTANSLEKSYQLSRFGRVALTFFILSLWSRITIGIRECGYSRERFSLCCGDAKLVWVRDEFFCKMCERSMSGRMNATDGAESKVFGNILSHISMIYFYTSKFYEHLISNWKTFWNETCRARVECRPVFICGSTRKVFQSPRFLATFRN